MKPSGRRAAETIGPLVVAACVLTFQ